MKRAAIVAIVALPMLTDLVGLWTGQQQAQRHTARCAYAAAVVDTAIEDGWAEDDIGPLLSPGEDCRGIDRLLVGLQP